MTMSLTNEQRAAVRTWRQGNNHSIVADLPFDADSHQLPQGLEEYYYGRYLVCEIVEQKLVHFILSAARAAAENTTNE